MKQTIRRMLSPFEKFVIAELFWMISRYLIARVSNKKLQPLHWLIRKNAEILINRTKLVRGDNSFANEAATLQKIFEKMSFDERFLVDIGASDGIRQSSTSLFLDQHGWKGTLFEADADSFSKLAFLYNDRDDVQLYKGKVTPTNISVLLEGMDVPKNFGFLNVDIDSYDLTVLRRILDYGYNPSVISIEINEIFPPEIIFEVLYDPGHTWNKDHFFGCSLAAAYEIVTNYGYVLVQMEYNNAFFVREIESTGFKKCADLKEAYDEGYRTRKDRLQLFPWNSDMEFLLSNLLTIEKIKRVEQLFVGYSGKYRISERYSNSDIP